MGCYAGGTAICPYYLKDAEKSITCEGVLPSTSTMVRFNSAEEKRLWLERCCSTFDYNKLCVIAMLITAVYADDEK